MQHIPCVTSQPLQTRLQVSDDDPDNRTLLDLKAASACRQTQRQGTSPLLGCVAGVAGSLCEKGVKGEAPCAAPAAAPSSVGSLARPASLASMLADACSPDALRWSSMSISSSEGGYVMWVDAAIAARSILCRAGAMASDSAAAPALPSPAESQESV